MAKVLWQNSHEMSYLETEIIETWKGTADFCGKATYGWRHLIGGACFELTNHSWPKLQFTCCANNKESSNAPLRCMWDAFCFVFLRTRPRSSKLTCFVIMIIINDCVNDVSNFVIKRPRDTCEVSNWVCFFKDFKNCI